MAGSFYLHKKGDYSKKKIDKLIVYFLWFTFFSEVVLGWPGFLNREFEELSFLKIIIPSNNSWIFNTIIIVKFLIYSVFFKGYILSVKFKRILNFLIITFLVTSILNLILTDVYFVKMSSYTYICGSILLLTSVLAYFYEILRSDEILNITKSLPFYISIGALVFHLCMTPLFIYTAYFITYRTPDFSNFYHLILTSCNIFMYSCYSIGFIVTSKFHKEIKVS